MENLQKIRENQLEIMNKAIAADKFISVVIRGNVSEKSSNLLLDEAEALLQECVSLAQLSKEYYKQHLTEVANGSN